VPRILTPIDGPYTLRLRRWIAVFVGGTAIGLSIGTAPAVVTAAAQVPPATFWMLMIPLLILPLAASLVAALALLKERQRDRRESGSTRGVESHSSWLDAIWQSLLLAVLIGYAVEVLLTAAVPLIPSLPDGVTVARDTPIIGYFLILGITAPAVMSPRMSVLYVIALLPPQIMMLAASRGSLGVVSIEQPPLFLTFTLAQIGAVRCNKPENWTGPQPSAAGKPSPWPRPAPAPWPSGAATASSTTTSCPSSSP